MEITRAGKPFATLLPAMAKTPRRFKMPDIMARLNHGFGESCYDADDLALGISESRGEIA